MTPIVDRASTMSADDYHVSFITTLTGFQAGEPETAAELVAAERNRLLAAPWSFDLPTDVLSVVPTLVLTGAWSDEYEEIGQTMAGAGARHTQLVGFGHRVQDHPDANSAIAGWVSSH